MTKSYTAPAALVMALLLLTATALGRSEGQAPGYAGNPPNWRNCVGCHQGVVNSGEGSIELTGIGETFNYDTLYDLTVTVTDPDAAHWGFQCIALYDDWTVAGSLQITDEMNTTLNEQYVNHTSEGSFPGQTGGASWSFQWFSPEPGQEGPITFYFSGLGGNNNSHYSGDMAYKARLTVEPEATGVGDSSADTGLPATCRIVSVHPNPFNSSTNLEFFLNRSQRIEVAVYTLDGRRVATLQNGILTAGTHRVSWRAGTASGIYFVRFREEGGRVQMRKVALIR